jgi:hypothetical protein
MISGITTGLAEQSDVFLVLVGICCLLVGFSLAQLLPGTSRPLHRVGYWICTTGLFLAFAVILVLWAPGIAGNDAALLGELYLGGYGAVVLLGFFAGRAARARSISICGCARFAWVALVPGLNCVLALYRPGVAFRRERPAGFVPSVFGLSAGVLLAALGGGLLDLRATAAVNVTDYAVDDAAVAAMKFAGHVKRSDLADVLSHVAAEMPTNLMLDDGITLVGATSTRDALVTYFVLGEDSAIVPGYVRQQAVDNACGDNLVVLLMQAGAEVRQVFERPSGGQIGFVTIQLSDCLAAPNGGNLRAAAINPGQSPQI